MSLVFVPTGPSNDNPFSETKIASFIDAYMRYSAVVSLSKGKDVHGFLNSSWDRPCLTPVAVKLNRHVKLGRGWVPMKIQHNGPVT